VTAIRDNNTVAHIGELFHAAKLAGITVAVSPHYFYPTDGQWLFGDPLEKFMRIENGHFEGCFRAQAQGLT
jgi:hypothetical protein